MRDMQDWRAEGNCADLTPEESDKYFFLGQGGSPMKTRALFCDSCPVKKECFEFAVLYDEDGIWGGATEKQRKIVAPLLKPRLRDEAQQEGRLESRSVLSLINTAKPQVDYEASLEEVLERYYSEDIEDPSLALSYDYDLRTDIA